MAQTPKRKGRRVNRDIDFMYELGSLKNVERGWRQHFGMRVATIPEHTHRVMLLALVIARMEGVKNEEKILKMALIHDLAETRTTDLSYIQKVYVEADEDKSAKDLFEGTLLESLRTKELHEYEERQSVEAKIVKDADNLDVDLEMKELEERGSKLPEKWLIFRKLVRDTKLYTKSAKKLWDEIEASDPADWHIRANKWVKQPQAGK